MLSTLVGLQGRGAPAIRLCIALVVGFLLGPGSVGARADVPWATRKTGYLSTRDGTRLHYSVLLPRPHGRFPVVVNYNGYDAGSIGGAAYEQGETAMWVNLDHSLVNAGYAVMGVNMRGTGCSEGLWDLFTPKWGTDGADAIEWAAAQPWSTGRIGMANWSFSGISQLFTASQRPPHLRAIAPGMPVTDAIRDISAPGGVTNFLFPSAWWAYIESQWANAGVTAAAEADATCSSNLAAHEVESQTVSPPAQAPQHPYVDALARSRELWRVTGRINIPAFAFEVWQDESNGSRAGYYEDTLSPKRTWYLGTNGQHDIYTSLLWRRMLIRFFDRFLKGKKNGFDREPHVTIWGDTTAPGAPLSSDEQLEQAKPSYVITRPRWPVHVHPMPLYLQSHNRLKSARPGASQQPDSYQYPVSGPAVNADITTNETEWQDNPPSQNGTVAFTTSPLRQPLSFFGSGSADLWVSSTASDADLQVTLTEVRPDGKELYVQRGWLRLSQRAIDRTRSTSLRPFHPQTKESVQMLQPGKPVLARLEISPFFHTFRRDSSIRIWIDTPSTTGEWGFQVVPDPQTIQVWHDTHHPSRLMLGYLRVNGVPALYPVCDSLTNQPCRDNPLPVPPGAGPKPPAERKH